MRGSLDRLRALAARILDLRTMERVIDPLLADVQMEYEDANRRGRVWTSRWTLLAGHVAFLKTVVLCEAEDVMTLFSGWHAEDIAALKRTLGVSVAAIAATTVVLEIPPLLNSGFTISDPKTILYLMPQALVLAVPMGFTVGVFFGLRGRVISLRSTGAVLACAILFSFVCLAMLAWIMPWANEDFRQVVFRHVSEGHDGAVAMKGFNELTLPELSERIGSYRRTGIVDSDPRLLALAYHQRWALSCATVILSIFALAVTQRMVTGWAAALGASGTLLIYYMLLWIGRTGVLQHNLPVFVGAWLPNTLFALVCVAVIAATSRRASPPAVSVPAPGVR
jgi:lipopolysaccharide export system permease LptF/LptG-like protein